MPAQIVVADAVMLTEGGRGVVTVIEIELDVAVDGAAQASVEVITAVTASLLASDAF